MNYSEIKELLNAGFTHDEIMSFATSDKTTDKTPEETPEKTPVEKQIEGLTSVVGTLLKAMQESNIINSSINTLPGSDTGAVDSIMASIIRPERKV